jgi:putative ubiquitin-RnfH superfamily antitoxin RatB of RatAB toxin-antitoxin module
MDKLNIELIYPLPSEQELICIAVELGTNVEQAIMQSNILNKYPEIDLSINKVGIFSKVTKLTEILREGDRIEIYRPLIADPKVTRMKKALKQDK